MIKLWKSMVGQPPIEPARFYLLDEQENERADNVDHDHVDGIGDGGDGERLANNVVLENLENYCVALDDIIETGKRYIDVRKELTSLTEIRHQLSTPISNNDCSNETSVIIPPGSEDNVPEELKCPVCFEIYGEGVVLCINGHSTCTTCCEALRTCPECRANYNDGKIRNRAVESLMTSLKVCCIYSGAGCDKQLICIEMQTHVETCEFMGKPVRSPEYKEIRKLARAKNAESKRLEKRLQECMKILVETRAAWRNAHEELCSSHDSSSKQVKVIEEAVKDFRLETMEVELNVLYGDLNGVINC